MANPPLKSDNDDSEESSTETETESETSTEEDTTTDEEDQSVNTVFTVFYLFETPSGCFKLSSTFLNTNYMVEQRF